MKSPIICWHHTPLFSSVISTSWYNSSRHISFLSSVVLQCHATRTSWHGCHQVLSRFHCMFWRKQSVVDKVIGVHRFLVVVSAFQVVLFVLFLLLVFLPRSKFWSFIKKNEFKLTVSMGTVVSACSTICSSRSRLAVIASLASHNWQCNIFSDLINITLIECQW